MPWTTRFRLALGTLLLLCAGCVSHPPSAPRPASAVVLVSIDGLPASILGQGTLPTLDRLADEGVRAAWMNPSYPTLTFPNHYTLVTGLRPDHHGIVHNKMRDPVLGRYVSKEASGKDGRWYGGEPLWTTLQKHGGHAATMFWPGSEAEISGQRPRNWMAFDKTLSSNARVDQVLVWLDLPASRRPQFVTLYFDDYDVAAHAAGTSSPEALAALRKIDVALARLLAGLQTRGLRAGTDVIVLSDHGMADTRIDQVRYLDDVLAPDAYDVDYGGVNAGIVPKPGREQQVARAFVGAHDRYRCWRKSELPAAWHYGKHPRVPPIVCQPDTGWRLQLRSAAAQKASVKGEHGYAPEAPEMRAVFVASGPDFSTGVRLPAFDNVDVYPLLARLIGVTPAPNDGDIAPLLPALRNPAP